jgi:hypothetical protein
MSLIEQAITAIPLGTTIIKKAEDSYVYSKDKTLSMYNQTKEIMLQSK